ncbi:hypothetical protein TNCT_139901 [Trichonephila clavata]|uniref:Uncharacterized protein n=1 Tax=Trichonephila clavata TaxID=2740835 RepID=A0A8X6H7I6_TRICU|nr:hypothetical protein TNCT_139901 [Trichonephila clavata]
MLASCPAGGKRLQCQCCPTVPQHLDWSIWRRKRAGGQDNKDYGPSSRTKLESSKFQDGGISSSQTLQQENLLRKHSLSI